MVVYKVTFKELGKLYIVNTQRKIKQRINQQLGEVCIFINKGKLSDTFYRHLGKIFQKDVTISLKHIREKVEVEIL